MKSTYKNALHSKERIKQALFELLKKGYTMDTLTITDISKVAHINRGTFYNHYQNVVDVVNEVENELMTKLISTINVSLVANNSIKNFIYTITQYLKSNEELYFSIVSLVPRYVLDDMKIKVLKQLQNIIITNQLQNQIDTVVLDFVASGLAGIYVDYFEKRINLTLDELGQVSLNIIEKLLNIKCPN